MIDTTVQYLLEKAIDTPTKLHLLLIFHENSRLNVTASSMAERCCRDIWSVAEALHELTEDGILVASSSLGMDEICYSYMPQVEYVEPIRKLLRGYDDPIERDVLQRSIRELSAYASFRRNTAPDFQYAIV